MTVSKLEISQEMIDEYRGIINNISHIFIDTFSVELNSPILRLTSKLESKEIVITSDFTVDLMNELSILHKLSTLTEFKEMAKKGNVYNVILKVLCQKSDSVEHNMLLSNEIVNQIM